MSHIINTRADLDKLSGTPAYDNFMRMLHGSLWRFDFDRATLTYSAVPMGSTMIEQFGFSRADFPDAPPAPPVYTPVTADMFAARKANALAAIEQYHADTLQRLVGAPTTVERDTWAMKLDTARAVIAGVPPGAAGEVFLAEAGLATQEAKLAWANKVQLNANTYSRYVGLAEALRKKAKAAIVSAVSEFDLEDALATSKADAEAVVNGL